MENEIKYCVTAYIDLLGFSSHLEISSNDLRTQIGQEAIKRLNLLESALLIIEKEKDKGLDFFPESLYVRRINDALILTIDLPDFLKPSIGESFKNGITKDDLDNYFNVEELPTWESALVALSAKVDESIESLLKFVGLVSRIHNFINKNESKSFFPGAKTIISTGFRKKFINRDGTEDNLAANFSFSNAYIAEQQLHGAKIYIDCYILQLLSNNRYSRNIVKSSVFINDFIPSDPFVDRENYLELDAESKESCVITVTLFRKKYLFREINSKRTAYLQIIPKFSEYMISNPLHVNTQNIYKLIFSFIASENADKSKSQKAFLFSIDLDDDIQQILNHILHGKLI
jgi:hypothetical protein